MIHLFSFSFFVFRDLICCVCLGNKLTSKRARLASTGLDSLVDRDALRIHESSQFPRSWYFILVFVVCLLMPCPRI